jgi:hypothetical protein
MRLGRIAFSGEVDPVRRRKCGWEEMHFPEKRIRFAVEKAQLDRRTAG